MNYNASPKELTPSQTLVAKKPYQTPRLVNYGLVSKLTRGPNASGGDGASGMMA